MKNITVQILLVIALFTSSASVQASTKSEMMKPATIFTPKSFDSNDNAQVVIAGAFTGFCMKMGNNHHRVDKSLRKIYIDQSVSVTSNCKDLEMYIPYSSVISLGSLPAGNYEVLASGADGNYSSMAVLPIAAATISSTSNGTDARLYAPVSSVEFKNTGRSTNPLITIKGVFTNTCLVLDSVEVYARAGDVYEVLPVVKMNKDNCNSSMQPFSKTVELKSFSMRDTLIHVRSMNGQSLNKVITNLDRINHQF